jgi:hypothetical protein
MKVHLGRYGKFLVLVAIAASGGALSVAQETPPLSESPSGAFEAPSFEVIDVPLIELPAINLPAIVMPAQPALPSAEEMAANGARLITEPCSLNVGDVCAKLGSARQATCSAAVENWMESCAAVFPRTSLPSVALCHSECQVFGVASMQANTVLDLVLSLVDEGLNQPDELTQARAATKILEAELAAFEETIQSRCIHIYTNSETGAIIQHDGDFFEPQPPLEYTGEMPAPPTSALSAKRQAVEEQLAKAIDRLAEVTDNIGSPFKWHSETRGFWTGQAQVSTFTGCTRDQVPGEVARCKAFCSSQGERSDTFPGPQVLDICQPNSMFGFLYQPMSRRYLYPPEHPWRKFGFGR